MKSRKQKIDEILAEEEPASDAEPGASGARQTKKRTGRGTETPEERLILREYFETASEAVRRILKHDQLMLEVFTRLVIDEERFIEVYKDLRGRIGRSMTKKRLSSLKDQSIQRVRFFLPKKMKAVSKEEEFKKKYGHLPQ